MCQEIADEENILPALRSLANETLFYIINLGVMWFLLEGILKKNSSNPFISRFEKLKTTRIKDN